MCRKIFPTILSRRSPRAQADENDVALADLASSTTLPLADGADAGDQRSFLARGGRAVPEYAGPKAPNFRGYDYAGGGGAIGGSRAFRWTSRGRSGSGPRRKCPQPGASCRRANGFASNWGGDVDRGMASMTLAQVSGGSSARGRNCRQAALGAGARASSTIRGACAAGLPVLCVSRSAGRWPAVRAGRGRTRRGGRGERICPRRRASPRRGFRWSMAGRRWPWPPGISTARPTSVWADRHHRHQRQNDHYVPDRCHPAARRQRSRP